MKPCCAHYGQDQDLICSLVEILPPWYEVNPETELLELHVIELLHLLSGTHSLSNKTLASHPGSSPTEKRGESLEDLITCPVTYYAWFYAWFS